MEAKLDTISGLMNLKYSHNRMLVVLFLVLATAFWSRLAHAQAISGDVVGTVTDKSGAAVAGVRLTATKVETGVATTTVTNDRGEFHFVNLPIGKYNVAAEASGFASKQVNDLAVLLNQNVTLDLSLDPASVKTVVEVSEAGVTIDTTTAQLESTFDSQEMTTLPAASQGSGVLNLALLNAGVSSAGGLGSGSGGPSVSGQRAYNNNFTVEGVDNNNKNNPGPVATVPDDAVASLSVLQNQFSPEFGHSNGGQFNTVVLSGTNSFHGRVYEYFQNRNLNAIDSLCQCTQNPRYDNNRFGGQVGGPIIKDKLFFFQNLEYNPTGYEGSTFPVLAPTSAGYTTLNSLSGLSQTNLKVLQQYLSPATQACGATDASPCPVGGVIQVAGTSIPVGTLSVAAPSYQNDLTAVTSVDYNISGNDSLRLRYIYAKIDAPDTSPNLPVFYGTSPTRSDLVNISEYHTFSPSISNEARLGYSRFYNGTFAPNPTFPGLSAFPSFNFADLAGLQFGPNSSAPNYTIINTYQLIDNIAIRKGNHDLRFGGEVRKYISPQNFIARLRGDYEYSTLGMYLQDLSPDQVGERSVGVAVDDDNQAAVYAYGNDNWHVRPNLTLNLGLRYEYTTVQHVLELQALNQIASVPGLITFGAPQAPKKNFMPRLGFAWAPGRSSNTSVRGGFGIGYDVLFDNIINNELPPELSVTEDVNLNVQSPNFLANGGLPGGTGQLVTYPNAAAAAAATSNVMPEHLKDPYAINWNLGIQHSFGKDFVAEVRYVGVHAVHQNVQLRPNEGVLVTPTNFLPTYLSAPTQATLDSLPLTLADLQNESNILPAYANAGFTNAIKEYSPVGTSMYHGLQTQLNKRLSNGLQFQAAWTWSRTIDDSSTDFFSTYLTPRRPQNFQDLAADRSVSGYSRAHRVTLAAIYNVPWYKGSSSWFLRNVVGNYTIAPVYTFESPEWGDVVSADDANFNGDSAGDRTIYNPGGVKGTGSAATPLMNSGGDTVAYLATNPTAEYIQALPGARTTSSRNTLSLPHINNWDLAATKRFNLTERFRFEFTVQAFNLWGHPQYVAGSLDDIKISQATEGSVLNYLTPGQPNFNDPRATFSSNPRSLQLVAKIFF